VEYLTYDKLVAMHVLAMRDHWGETYFGVSSHGPLKSALARPANASHYEQADGLRQAAYLFQGLLMNHGFHQGNKRTAWLSLRWFFVEESHCASGRTETGHHGHVLPGRKRKVVRGPIRSVVTGERRVARRR